MDMETMCRTCSSQLKVPRNIFETKNLLERILKFTDIQIRKDDGLPSNICEICDLKLEIADKFRREVGEADRRNREMLRQTTFGRDSRVRVASRRSTSTFRTVRPIRDGYERRLNRGDQQKITKSVPTHVSRVSRSSFHSESWRSEIKMDKRGGFEEGIAGITFDSSKAFAYSQANGRTLSNCYRLLIDYCVDYGVHENFTLPSSIAYNDVGPESVCVLSVGSASRETEVKSKGTCSDDDSTGSIVARTDKELRMLRYFKNDPLNLLRIKTIRPLVESIDGRLTEDGSSRTLVSTTDIRSASSSEATRKFLWSSSNRNSKSSDLVESTVDGGENASIATTRTTRRCSLRLRSSMNDDNSRRRAISLIFESNDRSAKKTSRSRRTGKNELSCVCPVCYRVCATSVGVQDKDELCAEKCDLYFECTRYHRRDHVQCQFLFHDPVSKIHFKTHRSSRCPICEKPTRSKGTFRSHMKRHLLASKKNEN